MHTFHISLFCCTNFYITDTFWQKTTEHAIKLNACAGWKKAKTVNKKFSQQCSFLRKRLITEAEEGEKGQTLLQRRKRRRKTSGSKMREEGGRERTTGQASDPLCSHQSNCSVCVCMCVCVFSSVTQTPPLVVSCVCLCKHVCSHQLLQHLTLDKASVKTEQSERYLVACSLCHLSFSPYFKISITPSLTHTHTYIHTDTHTE